tara:strand:- start:246 stop:485 length:240 start_codon:yes stop_codon:yes gene_type:complete
MFSSNQIKESELTNLDNIKVIDPFTKWLIRIACILLILFFSGMLLGIPIIISFAKSQLDNSLLSFKEVLKTFIETFLYS